MGRKCQSSAHHHLCSDSVLRLFILGGKKIFLLPGDEGSSGEIIVLFHAQQDNECMDLQLKFLNFKFMFPLGILIVLLPFRLPSARPQF